MIYLDYNATTPVKPAVQQVVAEAMARGGNPSSPHALGRAARRDVEQARATIAQAVGVRPPQVIFTSGGTEADHLALSAYAGVGKSHAAGHVYASAVEHEAVLANIPSERVIGVLPTGVIDLAHLRETMAAAPPRSLFSVILANNVTGVINPVHEVSVMAREYGHVVHTDAVQALGRMAVNFKDLGVGMMSLSGHKIGGVQGAGALIVAEDIILTPPMRGGGQEMRRRAGTENVPAIVGFGKAVEMLDEDRVLWPIWQAWRDDMATTMLAVGAEKNGENPVRIIGAEASRIPNTLCVSVAGMDSATQVMAMDLAGVAVSAGSACSSGSMKISPVMTAMGLGDAIARSTLRISMGWNTTQADIDRALAAWSAMVG